MARYPLNFLNTLFEDKKMCQDIVNYLYPFLPLKSVNKIPFLLKLAIDNISFYFSVKQKHLFRIEIG